MYGGLRLTLGVVLDVGEGLEERWLHQYIDRGGQQRAVLSLTIVFLVRGGHWGTLRLIYWAGLAETFHAMRWLLLARVHVYLCAVRQRRSPQRGVGCHHLVSGSPGCFRTVIRFLASFLMF